MFILELFFFCLNFVKKPRQNPAMPVFFASSDLKITNSENVHLFKNCYIDNTLIPYSNEFPIEGGLFQKLLSVEKLRTGTKELFGWSNFY